MVVFIQLKKGWWIAPDPKLEKVIPLVKHIAIIIQMAQSKLPAE